MGCRYKYNILQMWDNLPCLQHLEELNWSTDEESQVIVQMTFTAGDMKGP